MKFSLRTKFFALTSGLLIFVSIAAAILINIQMRRFYKSEIINQLRIRLDEVQFLLSREHDQSRSRRSPYSFFDTFAEVNGLRITLIDSAGIVLFDSEVPRDSLSYLENHLHRPEVQEALLSGFGQEERVSATTGIATLYAAKLLDTTNVAIPALGSVRILRVAVPLVRVNAALGKMRTRILLGSGAALLLIVLLSYRLTNKFTGPIRELILVAESVKQGNLDAEFDIQRDDEIGELATILEEMVNNLRDDLTKMQQLQKARSQFLGNVSHELRTPIFALEGYLETLLHQPVRDAEKRKEFIEKSYKIARRLDALLTDLIDISRMEAGELKMSFRYFDVREWLFRQAREFMAKAQDFKIDLVVQPESEDPVRALGDVDMLNQVLSNLINNAIKYNRPGGKIEVGYNTNPDSVEIYVKDTGHGIAPEHLPRIFERFYRVDRERSRAVGGTGLGLAIVKHIVEAHGSTMHVESRIGKGSVFRFKLKKK